MTDQQRTAADRYQGPVEIVVKNADQIPAEAANFFGFSWNTLEVQLLVGYMDMTPPKVKPGKAVPRIEVEPTHRIFMSVKGFALLRDQIEEAARALEVAGVPLKELNPRNR